MDNEFNNENRSTNRFIFSDDFYDQLDSNENVEDTTVSKSLFEMPSISPVVEEKKSEVEENLIDETVKEEVPITNSFNSSLVSSSAGTDFGISFEKSTNTMEPIEKVVVPEPMVQPDTISYSEPVVSDTVPILEEEVPVLTVEENHFVSPVSNEKVEIPFDFSPTEVTSEVESSTNSSLEPSGVSTNNYNVESGIDTKLEQELLKAKADFYQPQIVVNSPSVTESSNTKNVYRAQRRAQPISPIWEEPKEKAPTISVRKPEYSQVEMVEEDKPSVINIDEELAKEIKAITTETDNWDYEGNLVSLPVVKSELLKELQKKETETGKISILARYGEDFGGKDYITNPAIGRSEEIKQLILILLTPEKSAILVGKPGIGKTSIVEGLAYQLQRNNVPDALKGYRIVSIKTTSLLGTLPTGETRLQTLIDELKELDKVILFMDEIHMLMGATNDSSLDFANMFKESLGRGSIKMIGATTDDEYERYVLRDKAFVRRFQRVDVEEPTREQTIKILMGTLPKIQKNTGAALKYSNYTQSEIMAFIVDITTEYKRVYGIGSRYPDICLTLLAQAFSQAVFDNRKEVNILDIRNAIYNSKNIYPDVIRKELINFDTKFKQLIEEENHNY